jgi:hypothetical protein
VRSLATIKSRQAALDGLGADVRAFTRAGSQTAHTVDQAAEDVRFCAYVSAAALVVVAVAAVALVLVVAGRD